MDEPELAALAKAIYDGLDAADETAYMSEFKLHKTYGVTIDGSFDLRKAAEVVAAHLEKAAA